MKNMVRPPLSSAAFLLAAALAQPAFAQDGGVPLSREVVQPLPSKEVQRLDDALRRLARNSRNLSALTDAGSAALELGDLEAAMGFFGRAQDLSPSNASVKMGMAAVFLRSDRPIEALRLFTEAEAAGASSNAVAAERGLAFDLVGNNAEAQASYKIALERGAGPDVARRLAISHAIAGNREDFEIVLRPLVANRDFAAFRARAFGLAILGETGEANAIADAVMPRDLAARMAPYLNYMPRLTKAQQAAAANLGIFPKAVDIGRDDPRIAQYSGSTNVSGADARLAPQGAPLGRAATDSRRRRPDRTGSGGQLASTVVDTPAVAAQPSASATPAASELPAVAATVGPSIAVGPSAGTPPGAVPNGNAEPARVFASQAVTQPVPVSANALATLEQTVPAAIEEAASQAEPVQLAAANTVADAGLDTSSGELDEVIRVATPASSADELIGPKVDQDSPKLGFDLERVATLADAQQPAALASEVDPASSETSFSATAPAPNGPVVQTVPPARPSVSDAFADFASGGRTSVSAAAGAVDISTLAVKREAPPQSESTPAKPNHPKRYWVQIASVSDRAAMKPEFRRIARKADDLLDGYSAHAAEWGETNRLLAGPVSSQKAAQELVSELKGNGVDSFVHTSPEGKKVDKIQ